MKIVIIAKPCIMLQEAVKQAPIDLKSSPVSRWDDFGIITSAVCLVHCIAMPLCLSFIPASIAPLLGHNDCTHLVLAVWVILFCCLGILPRLSRNPNRKVALLMTFGLSLVIGCTVFDSLVEEWQLEMPLMTVGNLLVISAHWANKQKRCCLL